MIRGQCLESLSVGIHGQVRHVIHSGIAKKTAVNHERNAKKPSAQGGTRTRIAVSGRGILNHKGNTENTGKNVDNEPGVSHLFPSLSNRVDDDALLGELIDVWQRLNDAERNEVMRVARDLLEAARRD
jgi:hypothetical protein